MKVSRLAPLGQNVLTHAKDLASLKCFKLCANFHLQIATWSPSQNAAVMWGEAGVTSVNSVPFLELDHLRRCVHMALALLLMAEILMNVKCFLTCAKMDSA